MSHFVRDIRYRSEFAAAWCLLLIVKSLPLGAIRPLAWGISRFVRLVPGAEKIVRANLHTAMPERSSAEIRSIAKKSFFNMTWNLLEFFWVGGIPERIRRCYHLPEDIVECLKKHMAAGERVIFVNPHLGSWEASGTMPPFYTGMKMAAIAKPVRNPYLNKLLNSGGREKTNGLEVIFSKGAMRAALHALKQGKGLGTLIDQNTRVRDGGVFVDFFGVPVPSSTAPATLKRYCDAHGIPTVIIYGTSLRLADGRNTAHIEYLSKPFSEYADDREVLQELMQISEKYIRMYPDQYLWFYKRFQYIAPNCPEEIRKRYPEYAVIPRPEFFRKAGRQQELK